MTDDGSAGANPHWPLPTFTFKVTWDRAELSFHEIEGLEAHDQAQAAPPSGGSTVTRLPVPGQNLQQTIKLSNGVVPKDHPLFDWYTQDMNKPIVQKTLHIALLDKSGATQVAWTVKRAYPIKVSTVPGNTSLSSIQVEEVAFAHEGVSRDT